MFASRQRALEAPAAAAASRNGARPPGDARAVEVRGLQKRFRGTPVLRNLTLAVPAGGTFGLLGPNGSGKTTLLRLLAGILKPDGGTVEVLGKKPLDALPHIGYMPQQFALYPKISVWENIRYFGGLQGAGSSRDIDPALDAVGLLEHKRRILGELSQGTQRRLSLACALVHRPRLLLLDEPTAGVDPLLRAAFWDHFRRLNESGVTVVLATHDMDEAARCDTLAVLRDGGLLVQARPVDLVQQLGVESVEDAYVRLAGGGR